MTVHGSVTSACSVGDERTVSVECEVWWCVVIGELRVGRDPGVRSAAVGVVGTLATGKPLRGWDPLSPSSRHSICPLFSFCLAFLFFSLSRSLMPDSAA